MQVTAKSISVKVSPRKARLVADSIRALLAKEAVRRLSLTGKRASVPVLKTIKSAMANALSNAKLNEDLLFIKEIFVNEGPVFKRFRPSTRGRVHPYKKRTSNITVILGTRE